MLLKHYQRKTSWTALSSMEMRGVCVEYRNFNALSHLSIKRAHKNRCSKEILVRTSTGQKHVLMVKPRHSACTHKGWTVMHVGWGLKALRAQAVKPNTSPWQTFPFSTDTSPALQHQPLINLPTGTDIENVNLMSVEMYEIIDCIRCSCSKQTSNQGSSSLSQAGKQAGKC